MALPSRAKAKKSTIEKPSKAPRSNKKVKKAAKASFKRGGKGPSKSKKSRRASASSTAAPSNGEPALVEMPDSDEEAEVPKAPATECLYKGYDLEKLGIPLEARPSKEGKGAHSYTVHLQGAVFDILMRKRGFYIKKAVGEGKRLTVSWSKHQNVAEAWTTAKAVAGLPA